MKANLKVVRKNREFSDDFKRGLVDEFESGRFSVIQLSRLHGIHKQLIYNWIYKFSTLNEKGYRVVEHRDSSSKKLSDLEKRVRELEAAVGRKQIKIDFLEKMMDIAQEELDIDIKKNFSTPQSSGSGKTDKK